jgi:hypothetical protein
MSHKIQPLIPGNTDGLEEIAKQLLEGTSPEPDDKEEKHVIIPVEFTPEDFVLLQGRSHGNYSYPNLFVNMYRLGLNKSVETAAKNLRYSIANTAKEKNGRDYIGDINWEQGLKLNLSLGGRTLSPRQYVDFLGLLKSGNAVDGNGTKIPKKKLTEVFNEIVQVREPWRAEWLDADFKYLNEKLLIYSQHKLVNGNLDASYKKELEGCLIQDATPGIDFDYWLKNATIEGLPPANNSKGKLYYWCPDKDNNSVAGFGADSGWAGLLCYRNPSFTYSSLGVRLALPQGALAKK